MINTSIVLKLDRDARVTEGHWFWRTVAMPGLGWLEVMGHWTNPVPDKSPGSLEGMLSAPGVRSRLTAKLIFSMSRIHSLGCRQHSLGRNDRRCGM